MITLVNSITVNSTKETLYLLPEGVSTTHGSCRVWATVCPSNADNCKVRWSSSDPSVATVNPNDGLVLAQNVGSTIITATALDGSGVTGTYTIKVENAVLIEKISSLSSSYPITSMNTQSAFPLMNAGRLP